MSLSISTYIPKQRNTKHEKVGGKMEDNLSRTTHKAAVLAYSDIPRDTVLILGIVDLFVTIGFVVYVLIELRDCCPWVIVLPILHLWIWVFALGASNVRLDSVGFVYAFVGLLTVSFVIDLIVAIIELIVFIDNMRWQIIVLYAFAIVLSLLSIAQAIVATTLANAIWTERWEMEKLGIRGAGKKSKPIRGLVAVWISFDVFWFIIFWILAALTLRSCCWWIILFSIPHLELWLFALASANSRVENPWLFYLYVALAVVSTFLDLSALILNAFWFSDTREIIFGVWFIFFAIFLSIDVGNMLFSVGQVFSINDEAKRNIQVRYESLAFTKKTL